MAQSSANMTSHLRTIVVLGIAWLTVARTTAGELPTIHSFTNAFEQDCFFFAQNFCAAVVRGQIAADDVIDIDSIFGRSQRHADKEGALPPGLELKTKDAYRAQFAKQFPSNPIMRPIRVRREDKQARVTIRLVLPNGGLNYLDLLCERRFMVQPPRNFIEPPRGYQAVQAVDIFDWSKGEYASDGIFKAGKLFQEEWLKSGTRWEKWAKAMTELHRFRAAEDWSGFLKAYQKLAPELQADKSIALLRANAALHVGPREHLEALRFLQLNFPRDSSLEFATLDAAYLQKKYETAINVIDKIDERIGGDPYLEVLRATLYQKMEKSDLARERAKEGLRREPELARLLPAPLLMLLKGPQSPTPVPAVPATVPSNAPRLTSNKLRLQGVFLRADRPAAMISGQTLYEGDSVDGMQIVKIEKARVTLQSAAGELSSLTFD